VAYAKHLYPEYRQLVCREVLYQSDSTPTEERKSEVGTPREYLGGKNIPSGQEVWILAYTLFFSSVASDTISKASDLRLQTLVYARGCYHCIATPLLDHTFISSFSLHFRMCAASDGEISSRCNVTTSLD